MELTARIKSFLHLQNFCLRRCSLFPVSGCRDPFIWRRKRESEKKKKEQAHIPKALRENLRDSTNSGERVLPKIKRASEKEEKGGKESGWF